MDDKEHEGETPETATEGETPAAKTAEELERELKDLQAKLKAANRESAERRKRLEELEAEAKRRAEEEMTELERARKRAEEAEARLRELETRERQRDIAARVGLPPALADRIRGATPEEMEADARALLESLPKEQPKPVLAPTTGAGRTGTETPEQRRARLFGPQ